MWGPRVVLASPRIKDKYLRTNYNQDDGDEIHESLEKPYVFILTLVTCRAWF